MAAASSKNRTYTPATPFVTSLSNSDDGSSFDYEPMEISEDERHGPQFKLPHGMELSVGNLCALFLPDRLVASIAVHTNAHAAKRLPPERTSPAPGPITDDEIFRFLAVYYYMGLTRLPSRRDYWRCDNVWPLHKLPKTFQRQRFEHLWRNLSIAAPGDGDSDVEDEDGSSEDESSEWSDFDRAYDDANGGIIRRYQKDPEPEPDVDEASMPTSGPTRWFSKVETFIDHVNDVSQLICRHPGFACSINEPMRDVEGWVWQTARLLQDMTVEEEDNCKFLAICDASTGYVYKFEPNGRCGSGSTHDNVMGLAASLPQRDDLKYVVALEKDFVHPKIIAGLRNMGVAAVGIAQAKSGWIPEEITSINDTRFNSLHLMNDPKNFLIARWVDNNIVTMVSTIHSGTETQIRDRRRPRASASNRQHIESVWGDQDSQPIAIPGVVDDYKRWSRGVDKSDQLIERFRPNLRCRRAWMPLFFHCLDVIRANAYIAWRSGQSDRLSEDSQQLFVKQWSEHLYHRAIVFQLERTAQARQVAEAMRPSSPEAATGTNSELPASRSRRPRAARQVVAGAMESAPPQARRRTGENSELTSA